MNACDRQPARRPSERNPERDRSIAEHVEVARRISLRVARRCPTWIAKEDLVAAGMVGLAEAAERYDDSRNEPFLVFAEKRIRGAVLDELRRGDIMPRRQRQMARKVAKTIQSLEQQTGQPPDDAAIAGALGVGVAEYRAELEHLVHVSVGAMDGEDEGMADLDREQSSPAYQAERRELLERVRAALSGMDRRDVLLLTLYYDEERTYAEIGVLLGVTTSRVCQLQARAITRLRTAIETMTPAMARAAIAKATAATLTLKVVPGADGPAVVEMARAA